MTDPDPFVDAPTYIRENFEPSDRIALLLLNRETRVSLQRITTAEKAYSPDFQAWLRYRASLGEEVYIGMNTLKPDAWTRTKDQISTIRHLYMDLDRGGEHAIEAIRNSTLVPPPNYVLNTSLGKHQIVWKVAGIEPEQAEALQRAMVREFGGDPAATDSTRVLRLPTFANRKHDPPHMVTAWAEATETYQFEDFKLKTDDDTPRLEEYGTGRGRTTQAGEVTQSERDWAFAKRALARGDNPEDVVLQIARYRAGEKADPDYYARHTVDKALATLGNQNSPTDSNSEPKQLKEGSRAH